MGEVHVDRKKFDKAVNAAKLEIGIPFDLKDKQIECLESIVCGRDTVGVLATGYGKSLIYTLLPTVLDTYYGKAGHIVVVISPLVALMEEQRAKIADFGISTAYLGSEDLTSGKD
jgi:superfamily II DNA helicase RecQ